MKTIAKKRNLALITISIATAFVAVFCFMMFNTLNQEDSNIKSIFQSSSSVFVGDSQTIAVEFQNAEDAKNSELVYHKHDGSSFTSKAHEVADDIAIYDLPFNSNSQVGMYTLDCVEANQVKYPIEENKERGFSFAVCESNYNAPSDVKPVETHHVDNSALTELAGHEVQDNTQMLMTQEAVNAKNSYDPNNPNGFIVALDAGHGGSDPGACSGGWAEKDLNWSIAQYCGWELCTYSGVKVCLARNGDEYVGLKERVDRARAAGSNIFVCIHNNAGGGHGAEVWIQHAGGWHSEFSDTGAVIGNSILAKLSARLGLANRGLHSRTCTDGSTYPDGSIGDYFTVLYWAREYGMPAILIEHAYMDSGGTDSVVFSESGRKTMGISDAEAIAEYYGFCKGPKPYVKDMTDGSITLGWEAVEGAQKYAVTEWRGGYYTIDANIHALQYRVNNLVNGQTYQFLVQSYSNGQWSTGDLRYLITCKLAPRPTVTVEAVGDGTATLKWKNLRNCTQYSVYEKKGQDLNCIDYKIFSERDEVQYTINNLANGYAHTFAVQSYSSAGWSDFDSSKYVQATPVGRVSPYNLVAKTTATTIDLTWDKPPGIDMYSIYTKAPGSSWVNHSYQEKNNHFVIKNLKPDTEYEVTVIANAMGHWSSFDDSEKIKCHTEDISPVVSVKEIGDGTVTLQWNKIVGATRYAIVEYYADGSGRYVNNNFQTTDDVINYKIDNLANGYEHIFLVQSCVDNIWSTMTDTSKYVKATPVGPMKPTNIVASGGPRRIDVSWKTCAGASQYSIYTRVKGQGWRNHAYTITSTKYSIKNLEPGTEYEVIVIAYINKKWTSIDDEDIVKATTVDPSPVVSVKEIGDGAVTLQWNKIAGATRYAIVEYYADGSGRYVNNNFQTTDDVINYKIDNLANGYEHIFLVQSCVDNIWSTMTDTSKYVKATPVGPMKPTNIVASGGPRRIDVSWKTCAGASQYSIYTRVKGQGWRNHAYTITSTKYSIKNLEPGTEYEVIVIAYINKKWTSIDDEDIVKATTVDPSPVVSVKEIGDGAVTLQWNKIAGATRYAIVEYYVDGSGRYINNNFQTTDDVINYKIDNLANGYEHIFLVQSCVDNIWSTMTDTSKYVKATPVGPMKPTNLKGTPGSNNIYITWDKCAGSTAYSVYTRINGHEWKNHTYTLKNNEYTINNLNQGTEYEIVVIAYVYNKWTTFDESDIIKVKTIDTRPTPTVVAQGNGSITLQWNKVDNASKYSIKEIFNHDKNNYVSIVNDLKTEDSLIQYTIENLANGYEHEFAVQACVNNSWSDLDLSKCCKGIPKGPVRPYDIKATAVGYNRLDVVWKTIPGATCYGVWTRSSGSSWKVHDYQITGNSYSIIGIKGGIKYDIVVVVYSMGTWINYHDSDIIQATPSLDPNRPSPSVVASSDNSATLSWPAISNASNYGVYSKNSDGTYTVYNYQITGTSYTIYGLQPGNYQFLVRAWIPRLNKWSDYDDGDLVNATVKGMQYNPIMYGARSNSSQMVRFFNSSGGSFPVNIYSSRGCDSISTFCNILYEEALAEGVEPSVLFCQCMLETGWFRFGGQVKPEQCNFGGIGATDGGAQGAWFPDVRTGLRAQVQHLKAYASKLPLNKACVDPRFNLVTRGCAPYVENLGNGRWATSATYSRDIINLMSRLFAA